MFWEQNAILNTTKPNLLLYLPYYVETCSKLEMPVPASQRQDVEAVANRLL